MPRWRGQRVLAVSAVIGTLAIAAAVVTVWLCAEAAARLGAVAGGLHGHALSARAAPPEAAAASAQSQALWAGVTAVVLSVLALAGFAWYLTNLRTQEQAQAEDHQVALGQRYELVTLLRSAAAVLSEIAGQIRARAAEAVARTTKMSGAVAQTSATMQELAASAGSIVGNTRAAGKAAQQVQDTMGDMHQQAGVIASGALSLGKRAGEIGKILELVNQFTGQTSLLALNAEIEAARAGQTSDAVKLSSCRAKFCGGGGECGGFVVVLAGGQAVVQAAEEAAEQVALCGGVPVPVVFAPVVVISCAG
jgi:hypothetical protein